MTTFLRLCINRNNLYLWSFPENNHTYIDSTFPSDSARVKLIFNIKRRLKVNTCQSVDHVVKSLRQEEEALRQISSQEPFWIFFFLKLSSLFEKCLRFWFSQRNKDAGDLTVDGIHNQWKKEGQNEAGWRENESQGGQGGTMSKIYFLN